VATKGRQRLVGNMRKLRKGKRKGPCKHEEEEPHKSVESFVTFVEEFEELVDDKFEEGGLSPTIAQPRPNLERVQFHLDKGRVDLVEVFDHLNTSGLQYESRPGIWCDLKYGKSGKSAKTFKNRQEVHIRRTSLTTWLYPKGNITGYQHQKQGSTFQQMFLFADFLNSGISSDMTRFWMLTTPNCSVVMWTIQVISKHFMLISCT
jgi:hypothetical protein